MTVRISNDIDFTDGDFYLLHQELVDWRIRMFASDQKEFKLFVHFGTLKFHSRCLLRKYSLVKIHRSIPIQTKGGFKHVQVYTRKQISSEMPQVLGNKSFHRKLRRIKNEYFRQFLTHISALFMDVHSCTECHIKCCYRCPIAVHTSTLSGRMEWR